MNSACLEVVFHFVGWASIRGRLCGCQSAFLSQWDLVWFGAH